MSNKQGTTVPTEALRRWDQMSQDYQERIRAQRKAMDRLLEIIRICDTVLIEIQTAATLEEAQAMAAGANTSVREYLSNGPE